MANSFLDKNGLTYLWGKIVSIFAKKTYVDEAIQNALNTENNISTLDAGNITEY